MTGTRTSTERVAVLVHGAGSTPDAALRLLSPLVPSDGRAVAVDARADAAAVVERLAQAVEDAQRRGADVVAVAGLSLGAHAVALWAARESRLGRPVPRIALVMPAWTGAPGPVAVLTSAAAEEIERDGVDRALERITSEPAAAGDWVLDELVRAWTGADPVALAAALRAAAGSPGPEPADLLALRAEAVVVVGLADDPLHPVAVAREWAGAIPGAALRIVARQAPAADRAALGRAAADGLANGSR